MKDCRFPRTISNNEAFHKESWWCNFWCLVCYVCTGWPTDDLINEIKMSSVSLVPKLSREMSIPLRDIAWRYSFNNAEKVLILDCDQDVANSCRRPVLRVLKGLRIDYNWQCIRSYHLKTIMLHEFESHHPRQWSNENFLLCFKKSLERLQVFLQNKNCPHYFLPGINLFNNFSDEACRQMLQDICRLLRDPYQALKELNDPDEGRSNKNLNLF